MNLILTIGLNYCALCALVLPIMYLQLPNKVQKLLREQFGNCFKLEGE